MKRLVAILVILLMSSSLYARDRRTVPDTAAVKDLDTSSVAYQLPNPSNEYCIAVDGGQAWINVGASGVTATTSLTGYIMILQDGETYCDVFKPTVVGGPIYVAFISDVAAGQIQFTRRQ